MLHFFDTLSLSLTLSLHELHWYGSGWGEHGQGLVFGVFDRPLLFCCQIMSSQSQRVPLSAADNWITVDRPDQQRLSHLMILDSDAEDLCRSMQNTREHKRSSRVSRVSREAVNWQSFGEVISSRLISRVSSVVACLIIFSVQARIGGAWWSHVRRPQLHMFSFWLLRSALRQHQDCKALRSSTAWKIHSWTWAHQPILLLSLYLKLYFFMPRCFLYRGPCQCLRRTPVDFPCWMLLHFFFDSWCVHFPHCFVCFVSL